MQFWSDVELTWWEEHIGELLGFVGTPYLFCSAIEKYLKIKSRVFIVLGQKISKLNYA
jgi:hypothetical protein